MKSKMIKIPIRAHQFRSIQLEDGANLRDGMGGTQGRVCTEIGGQEREGDSPSLRSL